VVVFGSAAFFCEPGIQLGKSSVRIPINFEASLNIQIRCDHLPGLGSHVSKAS